MSIITTKDGTELFYKDWGEGPAVTLSHGWPLSADAWDGQMLFLAQHGFRVVAHDRRGHGRSSQPSFGNDMNTYADDRGGSCGPRSAPSRAEARWGAYALAPMTARPVLGVTCHDAFALLASLEDDGPCPSAREKGSEANARR
jgi:pimeloyl-ACP methyl ester carboxylesterase